MRNLLFVLLIVFANLTASAQVEITGNQEAANNSSNYSESIPYQPLIVVNDKKEKTKKKEKNENSRMPSVPDQETEYYVELPVYVSDSKDIPIKGLAKNQFTLFVNDIEQEIEIIKSSEQGNKKIILLLDISNSNSPDGLKDLQNFAQHFIERLPAGSELKIISFEEKGKILTEFTSDKLQLNKALQKLKYGGGTSLYEAVQYAAAVDGSSKHINVVLLTDGVDTTSRKADFKSSIEAVGKSKLVVFPFYINTLEYALNPKSFPKGRSASSLIFNSIIGGTIQNPQDLKKDYEFGKYYLTDLSKISAGKVLFAENLKTLEDKDFSYLLDLMEPQYYLGFRKKLSGLQNKNCQIKIRIDQANLTIRTKGMINLEGYKMP